MADKTGEEEKRFFPRVKCRAALRYQIRGSSLFNNTISEDICSAGVGFIADAFIAPSNNIGLQINVLSRVLNPIARVMWITPVPRSDRYHLGLKFVEFDPNEKKYLSDFIDMQTGKI